MSQDPESARLEEARTAKTPWRRWGPYLSERQWGTVREDYSQVVTPGTTSLMTRRGPAPITGARMALPASVMISSCCVSAWPCGMAKIPFSKNVRSV